MIFRIPLNRYVITASLIGMGGSTIGIAMLMKAQYRVLAKPYCTQALELLEANQLAVDLIGKPIKISRPDLIDKSQHFGSLLTDIVIPFTGAHKSGNLRIEADRATVENEWSVKKLEIKFPNMSDKLLIVYRRKEDPIVPVPIDNTTISTDSKHVWL